MIIKTGKEYQLYLLSPITGIYKISCKPISMVYIGRSTDVERRITTHLRELQRGKHTIELMQNHFDHFGIRSFRFELLERCNKSELIKRESYYIREYAFKGRGIYNINLSEAKRYHKDLESLESVFS